MSSNNNHRDVQNIDITQALDKCDSAITSLQNQHPSQLSQGKNQQIVEDLRNVIADDRRLISEKNSGDLLQNLIRHALSLFQEVSRDKSMEGMVENMKEVMGSVLTANDISELLGVGGHLVNSLSDTQIFLQASLQLINILKLFLAQKTEEITSDGSVDKSSSSSSSLKAQRVAEQEKLIKDIATSLKTLSTNPIWQDMVMKGKDVAERAKEKGGEVVETADDALTRIIDLDFTQLLIDDIASLLQRLVGNQMDVDPLFKYIASALIDLSNNHHLSSLIYDASVKLQKLINKNNIDIDDPSVRSDIYELSGKAEKLTDEIRSNPNVILIRSELQKLKDAIKKDPLNEKMINDVKRLWLDLRSENEGEHVDKQAMKGLRHLVMPLLLHHLSNIALPSISDSGDMLGKYEYTMANIHISVPELVPENVHLRFEYDLDAHVFDLSSSHHRTFAYLEANKIQIHLRDVAWTYKRNTIPRISDYGTVNFGTFGKGVTIRMKMEMKMDQENKNTKGHDNHNKIMKIEVMDAHCSLDRFHVTFTDSKHNRIYGALSHLFQNRIKRELQLTLENKLKSLGHVFNEQIINLLADARSSSHSITEKATMAKKQAIMKAEQVKASASSASSHWGPHHHHHHPSSSSSDFDDISSLKQDAKYRTKGAIVIASERVNQILDQQQEKLEHKLAEKQQLQQPQQQPEYVEMKERIEMKDMSSSSSPRGAVAYEPLLHPSFVSHGDSVYGISSSSSSSTISTSPNSTTVHEPLLHPSFIVHGDKIYGSSTSNPSSSISLEKDNIPLEKETNKDIIHKPFGAADDSSSSSASVNYSVHPSIPSFDNSNSTTPPQAQ